MSKAGKARDPEVRQRILDELRVAPGTAPGIRNRDTAWAGVGEYAKLSEDELSSAAKRVLQRGIDELRDAQELLWASDSRSLLVVFQAMDAAGKDSTIEHVMSGVNPQGVQVESFGKPSSTELDHDFLWRIAAAVPERGRIGIFNRSHYEEVVTLRVHPEWLEKQSLPEGDRGPAFWAQRYESLNGFEQHLDRNGTKVIKLFLNVSKAEQKRRLLARLDNRDKNWKFNADDVDERARWDDYMDAFEAAITATSTEWAPWYVVPADNKKVMQAFVGAIILDAIEAMDLSYPTVSAVDHKKNAAARKRLEAEKD